MLQRSVFSLQKTSEDLINSVAIKYFAERINSKRNSGIIRPMSKIEIEFPSETRMNSSYNSSLFQARIDVCRILEGKIAGILGHPSSDSSETENLLESITNRHGIPYLPIRWAKNASPKEMTINFHLIPQNLVMALKDLIEAYDWNFYAILYDKPERLAELSPLLNVRIKSNSVNTSNGKQTEVRTVIREAPSEQYANYRETLQNLRKMNVKCFVIYDGGSSKIAHGILQQAQELGMLTRDYSYIINSYNLNGFPIEKYQSTGANITDFRFINISNPEAKEIIVELSKRIVQEKNKNKSSQRIFASEHGLRGFPIHLALFYDALKTFVKAVDTLDGTQRIETKRISCNSSEKWDYGSTLLNYIKMVPVHGITGKIDFNNTPTRAEIPLEIIALTPKGIEPIGIWSPYSKPKINWMEFGGSRISDVQMRSAPLIAGVILSKPFCMLKTNGGAGNSASIWTDKFEGFVVDILNIIGDKFGWTFEIRTFPTLEHKGSAIGDSFNGTNQWNRLVEQTSEGKMDLIIGDLTITLERLKKIDFIPFLHLGISTVYNLPTKLELDSTSIFKIFSSEVWIGIVISYGIASIIIYLAFWLSEYKHSTKKEGRKQHSKNTKRSAPINFKITLFNSIWFILLPSFKNKYGCVQSQRGAGKCIIFASIGITSLLLYSMFTANLTATFLLPKYNFDSISLNDLIEDPNVSFNRIAGGTTSEFLNNSESVLIKQIWSKMLPIGAKNIDEGLNSVNLNKGKVALIAESLSIDYYLERICGLQKVEPMFHSISYGIGLPKTSKIHERINQIILQLQNDGEISFLKEKWWTNPHKGKMCQEYEQLEKVKPLRAREVLIPFVSLLIAVSIAFPLAICERLWWKYTQDEGDKNAHNNSRKGFGIGMHSDRRSKVKPKGSNLSIHSNNSGNEEQTTSFLDFGINGYGFPRSETRTKGINGGIHHDIQTF